MPTTKRTALILIGTGMAAILLLSSCATADAPADTSSPEPMTVQDTTTVTSQTTPATSGDTPSADQATSSGVQEMESATRTIVESAGADVAVSYRSLEASSTDAFNINGGESHVSASMIKLSVLAELFNQVSLGNHSLDEVLTMQQSDIVAGTGSIGGQGAGATFTLDQLASHMIGESDNTATNMLIDLLGAEAINRNALSLGLEQTTLNRKMMDLNSGVENYISANDACTILTSIYQGTFYGADLSARALQYLEAQVDTNGIAQGLPAGVTFAHKTGSLTNIQNDGGIVEGEHPYVLVVLCDGLGDSAGHSLMAEVAQATAA